MKSLLKVPEFSDLRIIEIDKQELSDIPALLRRLAGRRQKFILFIDDFLAYGNAAMGMVELAEQSGAVIEGMGFIIEKAFQDGGNLLREKGIRVESLAIIDNLDDCKITVR